MEHNGTTKNEGKKSPQVMCIVSTLDAKIKDLLATSATEIRVKL